MCQAEPCIAAENCLLPGPEGAGALLPGPEGAGALLPGPEGAGPLLPGPDGVHAVPPDLYPAFASLEAREQRVGLRSLIV